MLTLQGLAQLDHETITTTIEQEFITRDRLAGAVEANGGQGA